MEREWSYLLAATSVWMALVAFWIHRIRYPSFLLISPSEWEFCHSRHCRQLGGLVVLPMFVQLVGGASQIFLSPGSHLNWIFGLAVYFAWGHTFWAFAPLHNKLSREHNPSYNQQLVSINLLRTILWSVAALASVIAIAT